MNGYKLADAVAAADSCIRSFALVLLVLRCDADGRIREEYVVLADNGRAFDVEVRHQPGARADLDFRSDDAVWTDIGTAVDSRRRVNDGCRGNRHYSAAAGSALSCSLHMPSVSATNRPSTVALPAIFATDPFRRITTISRRS